MTTAINSSIKELTALLKLNKIGLPSFLDICNSALIGDASIDEASIKILEKHHGRFKRRCGIKRIRQSPELPFLYLHFARTYFGNSAVTSADRQAAWSLYKELKTRISSIGLADGYGTDTTALHSLYQIFTSWRTSLDSPETSAFMSFSDVFMNRTLRDFLAKWHGSLSDGNSTEFRTELKSLQSEVKQFIRDLEGKYSFV